MSKVFVLGIQFAEATREGAELAPYGGEPSSVWNHRLSRYYDLLEELGFRVLHQPPELVLSTSDHKWGAEPFHYLDEAYTWFGDRIVDAL